MADTARIDVDASERRQGSRSTGLLIGVAAMVALAAGGFFATYSGFVLVPGLGQGSQSPTARDVGQGVDFVPLEPLTVSLGPTARARHLRISGTLEVEPHAKSEVERLMPRVLDVLNTYLQALDERDVEAAAAMARMRAHMLRRIQIVTGEGRVRDLLITEFVLQ